MSAKFRIVEKVFEDGHKEYMAQEAVTIFGIPLFWKKYILREDDYGYGTIRYICCGKTYTDCLEQLKENLKQKEQERKKNTVTSKINHTVV